MYKHNIFSPKHLYLGNKCQRSEVNRVLSHKIKDEQGRRQHAGFCACTMFGQYKEMTTRPGTVFFLRAIACPGVLAQPYNQLL